MRVLLIEDSPRLQTAVGRGLRRAGYVVDVTGDGKEGLWLAESNDYDTIILDLMLPGLDGLTLLRRLRAAKHDAPVLILTAKDTVEDRVRGLEQGADDYLVKPFAFAELLARVQTLCRRRYGRRTASISIGDLDINAATCTVTRGGQPVLLTPREYRLLEYLAARRGEVVTRAEIETHIYGEAADPLSNVVDSAVCVLRRKLSVSGNTPLIHTRRGLGYVLKADPA